MSIWTAATDPLGRRKCLRCHKMFLPRREGQEYGPWCAQKVAAENAAQEAMWKHIEEVHPEIRQEQSAEESAVAAYLGTVLA